MSGSTMHQRARWLAPFNGVIQSDSELSGGSTELLIARNHPERESWCICLAMMLLLSVRCFRVLPGAPSRQISNKYGHDQRRRIPTLIRSRWLYLDLNEWWVLDPGPWYYFRERPLDAL